MSSEVTKPLGLSRTVLEDVTHPVPGRAKPYELDARNRAVPAPFHDVSWRWPAGGFLSTADDLARFGSLFVGGRFVSPATVRTFITSAKTAAGRETGYALGWETHATPFGPMIGHTGNTVGGTAGIVVAPQRGVALALASNVGYVTAPSPSVAPGTPEPPELLVPFLKLRSRP
jgi:serine beta-lactamase-like protein LACTB